MKTKIITLLILTSFLLSSCDVGGKAYTNVRKQYPDADIVVVPNRTNAFIIRNPNGDIYYYDNAGDSTTPTNFLLMPAKKI